MCKNSISSPPTNSPTAILMMITAIVSLIVSARVGQVTFANSATTSLKNLVGIDFGRLGTLGLSMCLPNKRPLPGTTTFIIPKSINSVKGGYRRFLCCYNPLKVVTILCTSSVQVRSAYCIRAMATRLVFQLPHEVGTSAMFVLYVTPPIAHCCGATGTYAG